ncbi:MAG: tRNA 2-thiouridine(34) synthase MnmA [Bacteroidales bacterium]|nr:tRNA 2-thiouridine(34) synthase MnmA [Bacteroidales bacterium]
MNKNRVAVAMSGGIDSSITALLLKEAGYDLVGVTLRIWDYLSEGCEEKETGCCSMEAIFEAKEFAEKLGIPHYIIDIRSEFKATVVQNFMDEYMSARTPNPCVMCNPLIKWGAILDFADKHDCYYMATGHYSQLAHNEDRHYITKAADASKDQSYVLWKLTQEQIQRTLLPLGEYTKATIKKLAEERGFVKLAKKKESQEVCFIPDNNYRGFLNKKVEDIASIVSKGKFVDSQGTVLGEHNGYPFYTIGQRKGLNIALGYPAYVLRIDKEANKIVLGKQEDLLTSEMIVTGYNGIKHEDIPQDIDVQVKIRYNSKPVPCEVISSDGNTYTIRFKQNVSAVTPGQSAVFYEGNDLIGGAIIVQ